MPGPIVPEAAARPAQPGDLTEIARLAGDAATEKHAQKGGVVWSRRERRAHADPAVLAEVLRSPDHRLEVGTLDGVAVGYATLRIERLDDGGRLGVIDELYVEPAARELGVGEVLMDHLLDRCREAGCFGVDSLALPGDRETKNFFESFGLVARAIIVHRPLGAKDV